MSINPIDLMPTTKAQDLPSPARSEIDSRVEDVALSALTREARKTAERAIKRAAKEERSQQQQKARDQAGAGQPTNHQTKLERRTMGASMRIPPHTAKSAGITLSATAETQLYYSLMCKMRLDS